MCSEVSVNIPGVCEVSTGEEEEEEEEEEEGYGGKWLGVDTDKIRLEIGDFQFDSLYTSRKQSVAGALQRTTCAVV